MKNNADIFNVTPPNAKDEDKQKKSGKYKLLQKNQLNQEWQGFTPSKIEGFDEKDQTISNKGSSTLSSYKYSNDRRVSERLGFDPFSQDWTNSSKKQSGVPPGSGNQNLSKKEMTDSSPAQYDQAKFSAYEPSPGGSVGGFNSGQKKKFYNGRNQNSSRYNKGNGFNQ